MSEIINNRQQRIEVMKDLIRKLHDGWDEAQVRKELETLLGEADYSDVFLMEVQLIQEGMAAETIQRLCDTHTRVLRKHLDPGGPPETVAGHPVHTFVRENQELTATTSRIRGLIEQVDALAGDTDATSLMRAIQAQLNDLMDVDKHYRRKENLLFPYFEKNDLPGPPTVMWGKDDEVRTLLKETIAGLQQVEQLAAAEAKAYNVLAVAPALEAVDDMVYKEEKILLPTAMNLLTEQDWYEIHLQSDEYGYCLYAPQSEWKPAGGLHVQISRPFAAEGRVRMPTGSFTVDELIAAFTAMPFDLTFVDRDDTVRYFTPGKERIFDRSRAILGRKVQYCHPPKSVHVVEKILEDFKNGRQDRARFWIELRGRMIYICYYAVRDAEGVYLGTLEVTQDLTEVRGLQGERRLLTYDETE